MWSSVSLLSLALLRLIPDASASVAPPQPLSPPPSPSVRTVSLHTAHCPWCPPLHPLMPVPTRFPGRAQDLSSASWRVELPTPFSGPLVPSAQGPCSLRMRAKHPLCPKPSLRPGPDLLRMSSLKDSHGWTLRMALAPLRPSLPPHHDPPTPSGSSTPQHWTGDPVRVVFPVTPGGDGRRAHSKPLWFLLIHTCVSWLLCYTHAHA